MRRIRPLFHLIRALQLCSLQTRCGVATVIKTSWFPVEPDLPPAHLLIWRHHSPTNWFGYRPETSTVLGRGGDGGINYLFVPHKKVEYKILTSSRHWRVQYDAYAESSTVTCCRSIFLIFLLAGAKCGGSECRSRTKALHQRLSSLNLNIEQRNNINMC